MMINYIMRFKANMLMSFNISCLRIDVTASIPKFIVIWNVWVKWSSASFPPNSFTYICNQVFSHQMDQYLQILTTQIFFECMVNVLRLSTNGPIQGHLLSHEITILVLYPHSLQLVAYIAICVYWL